MFVPTLVEHKSYHEHDATTNDRRNALHFEFVASAKALNTKHAKMDDLLEPFSAFGNASYNFKNAPEGGADTELVEKKHDISCKIILPKFASICVSPSAIEMTSNLQEIARQSSMEVYKSLSSDLQVEGIRDLWCFLDKVSTCTIFI